MLPYVRPQAVQAHTELEYGRFRSPSNGFKAVIESPWMHECRGHRSLLMSGWVVDNMRVVRGVCWADLGKTKIWADTSLGLLGTDERNLDHRDFRDRCFPVDHYVYVYISTLEVL